MASTQPDRQGQGQSKRAFSHRTDSIRSGSTPNRLALSTDSSNIQSSQGTSNQSPAQPVFRIPESPRSAVSESQSKAAKVAIPRLKRTSETAADDALRGGGRHRVNHACEPCRHRKTKCSGEKPVCRHCQDFKIACFYADGKRDRVKKQFGTMAEKVADYERLLTELMSRVPDDDASLIKASLDRGAQTELDDSYTETATLPSVEVGDEDEISGAETEASGRAGSTGALDRADEDFSREGARATGFMGKNSEVTWMQKVKQENRYGDQPYDESDQGTLNPSGNPMRTKSTPGGDSMPLAESANGFSVHESSYHLDDLAITTYEAVDPYEMPPAETAHILFTTYMRRVQPTFPIIGQLTLTVQFQRFISNPAQRPPDVWLAIVNLILAISAKYSHLVQAEWRGDERDHMIYFTRARLLAIDQDMLFNHPDLQQIQILGLTAFYLLCTSQVNRSWMLAGNAIRAATALGLNMRIDSSNLKDSLKEIRYRLWWALYLLENRLSSITGRVSCILDDHCTAPLPCPVDEDKFETEEGKRLLSQEMQQGERAPSANSYSPSVPSATPPEKAPGSAKSESSSSPPSQTANLELHWAKDTRPNSSLYFLHQVQLTRLTNSVFQRLYNPACIVGTWSFVQGQIKDLSSQLETWYRKLPIMYDFKRRQRDRDSYEARLSLGFFYYGTMQIIHRPCLCRLDRKIKNQSNKSDEFNRTAAMACVEAAQDSMRLIPDEPNAIGLIRVGPWWNILHWIVQSASVLMLEISYRAHHMPEEADAILESSKKAVRWLHALGEENLSAKRAWFLCHSMLREAAVKIGREVNDLPERPPGRSSMPPETNGMHDFDPSYQPQTHMHHYQHNFNNTQGAYTPDLAAYFSHYNPMMQYDQYFPNTNAGNMSMPHGAGAMYGTAATSTEMDYTSGSYQDSSNHESVHSRQGDIGGTRTDYH